TFSKIEVNPPNSHIHSCQSPGSRVAFLSINRNLTNLSAVLFNKVFTLHKKSAGTHSGVIHAAFEGLQHTNHQFYDTFRRIVLPAFFAFGQRKLTKEVFIDMA